MKLYFNEVNFFYFFWFSLFSITVFQAVFYPRSVCLFYSVEEVKLQGQLGACLSPAEEPTIRQHVEVQQRYVESLRQEIQAEQRRAERELEREQAHLRQQHNESKYSFHTLGKKK